MIAWLVLPEDNGDICPHTRRLTNYSNEKDNRILQLYVFFSVYFLEDNNHRNSNSGPLPQRGSSWAPPTQHDLTPNSNTLLHLLVTCLIVKAGKPNRRPRPSSDTNQSLSKSNLPPKDSQMQPGLRSPIALPWLKAKSSVTTDLEILPISNLHIDTESFLPLKLWNLLSSASSEVQLLYPQLVWGQRLEAHGPHINTEKHVDYQLFFPRVPKSRHISMPFDTLVSFSPLH